MIVSGMHETISKVKQASKQFSEIDAMWRALRASPEISGEANDFELIISPVIISNEGDYEISEVLPS
jgi:hypothetical protein